MSLSNGCVCAYNVQTCAIDVDNYGTSSIKSRLRGRPCCLRGGSCPVIDVNWSASDELGERIAAIEAVGEVW